MKQKLFKTIAILFFAGLLMMACSLGLDTTASAAKNAGTAENLDSSLSPREQEFFRN